MRMAGVCVCVCVCGMMRAGMPAGMPYGRSRHLAVGWGDARQAQRLACWCGTSQVTLVCQRHLVSIQHKLCFVIVRTAASTAVQLLSYVHQSHSGTHVMLSWLGTWSVFNTSCVLSFCGQQPALQCHRCTSPTQVPT
jgi:hypothetical protein